MDANNSARDELFKSKNHGPYFIKIFLTSQNEDGKVSVVRIFRAADHQAIVFSDKVFPAETLKDALRRFIDENFGEYKILDYWVGENVEDANDRNGKQLARYIVHCKILVKGELETKDARFVVELPGIDESIGDTPELRKELSEYLGIFKATIKGDRDARVVIYLIDHGTGEQDFAYVEFHIEERDFSRCLGVCDTEGRSVQKFLEDEYGKP